MPRTSILAIAALAIAGAAQAADLKTMGTTIQEQGGDQPVAEPLGAGFACSASAWVADNQSSSHATDIANPSGTKALKAITLYFTPAKGAAVYPVQWSWVDTHSGNPVTVEVTDAAVTLHIWSGSPLHGVWNGRSNPVQWTRYNQGYWRVVTCR